MKVIAAFLLAKLGGNESPTKDDLKNIFESVGAEFDEVKTDLFFSLVKDHDLTELIAAGREKMAALSSGGAASVAMVAGADVIKHIAGRLCFISLDHSILSNNITHY